MKTVFDLDKDYKVAELIGISRSDFSNRKKRETLITPIVNWAIKEAVDLNWLLQGQFSTDEHKPQINSLCVADRECDYNQPIHKIATDNDLIKMTQYILGSATEYADSLAANIKSFHKSVQNEKRIVDLESRIEALEKDAFSRHERRQNDLPFHDMDRRSGGDRRKKRI